MVSDQRLDGPGEGGAGGERELGVSEASTGGVPPHELRLQAGAVGERGGDDGPGACSMAVTFMVARPSPVAVTEQTGSPQPSVAVPLVTV